MLLLNKANLINWLILNYSEDKFRGNISHLLIYFLFSVASEEAQINFGFIHGNIQIFAFATQALTNSEDKTTFFHFQAQIKLYVQEWMRWSKH